MENKLNLDMSEQELGETLENLLKNASSKKDLNEIGRLINYGSEKKYSFLPNGLSLTDYQIRAARKMREINKK